MAVVKHFEFYQEPDNLPHLSRTETYNPINMQSSHIVKLYSLKGARSRTLNTYIDRPFSGQLWSRDLGLTASSFCLPVSFRERFGLSYRFNPCTISYSPDGTDSILIQLTFQNVFLMPRALPQKQETVMSYTAYDWYNWGLPWLWKPFPSHYYASFCLDSGALLDWMYWSYPDEPHQAINI